MNIERFTKTNKKMSAALMQMALMATSFSAGAATAAYYAGRRGAYGSGKNKTYLVDTSLGGISRDLFKHSKVALHAPAQPQITQADDLAILRSPVKELLVVDHNIKNYQQFSRLAKPGVALVEIPQGVNGFAFLLNKLAQYQNLSAIHLFSHANAGELLLGNTLVDTKTLKNHPQFAQVINQSVKAGGDFLLYGCELGKGETGDEFLEIIKNNTHADVAASNNFTGNAAFNGDWDLEIQKGDIEAKPLANSIAMKDFTEVLQTVTFQPSSWSVVTAGGIDRRHGTGALGAAAANLDAQVSQNIGGVTRTLTIDGEYTSTGVYNGAYYQGISFGRSEQSITLSFTDGSVFKPVSIHIWTYAFGDDPVTITTNNGGSMNTTLNYVGFGNPTQVIDLSSLPAGATSLTITNNSWAPFVVNQNSGLNGRIEKIIFEDISAAAPTACAPSIGVTDFEGLYSSITELNSGTGSATATVQCFDITSETLNPSHTARVSGTSISGNELLIIQGVGTSPNANLARAIIKSNDGSEFSFKSIKVQPFGNFTDWDIVYNGYKDGVLVSGASLSRNDMSTGVMYTDVFTSIPAFGNVDEIRIEFTVAGTAFQNFRIDDIEIGAATATPTNTAPAIAGTAAGQAVNDNATISPFTAVTITDADSPAQNLSVSVTLDNAAKGSFSTLNGFINSGGGVYTYSGTAAAAQAAIRGMVFTPAANRVAPGSTETTTFTISVNDGVAAAVTNNTTTVVSTSINDAPVIAGTVAGQAVNDNATISPFANVTITDADSPAQNINVDLFLDNAAKGSFSTLNGFTHGGGTLYNYSGTAAAAQAAIRGMVFTPAANRVAPGGTETTTFTIYVSDGIGLPVNDNTTTVVSTSVNDAPTLSGGPYSLDGINAGATSSGTQASVILAGLTYADVDAGAESGIALIASSGSGTWEYSTDGLTWNGVGAVSDISALLLSADTRVRYIAGSGGETASLTFRAWDRTSGNASTNAVKNTAFTAINGGTSAFSTGIAQVTIEVTALPAITSATYDAFSGVLTVTGTNLVANPSGGDIDVSKLSIVGEGGTTYTLTSANVEITNTTSFEVTLSSADKTAVNQIINKNGTGSTGGTTYNLAAADDWNTGAEATADIADLTGNGITVSNVAVPAIISASYDAATGTLAVTGTGFLKFAGSANDIVANKFTFMGEGGATYTLTDTPDEEITSGTSFTLTLSATDQAAILPLLNKNGLTSTGGTTYNLAAAEDWNAGADAAATIADLIGNGITVSNADAIAPTITGVTSSTANGTYKIGDVISVQVNFDEAVNVTGTPQLTLETGATDRTVDYVSGTGTATLTFDYTVQAGDASADLDYVSTTALALNGGSIKDPTGNNAVLTLSTPGAANSLGANKNIVVDGIAPAIPVNLAVTFGNEQNSLNWTANTDADLASYKVYGGTSTNPTVVLSTVTAPAVTYTHTGLTNGTTYYYHITAVDAAGNESAISTEESATPKGPQTITFNAIADKTYGDATFTLGSATSSGGLTVSYTAEDAAVVSISGNEATVLKAGTTKITATQTGNAAYTAATPVEQTLTVNPKAITATAQAVSKTYDGTATASITFNAFTTTDGLVGTDDVSVNYTEADYNTKHVGTNKAVTIIGLELVGTAKDNYSLNPFSINGAITQKAINVTAEADSKTYDGTTSSDGVPVVDALATGDVIATQPVQVYANKHVATGKTLIPSGLVINDGNNGANYTISYVNNTAGAITQKAINVTARADSKTYDGTTSSDEVPVTDALESGDVIATQPVQVYANKHVATGKTLIPSGLVINDGNNGANYTISYVNNTAGAITEKAINVTAQADSKTYDGTTSSDEVPVVDALETGDNIATPPVQAYNDKHVGTGKTLTASGLSINDGNNGANYTISYVDNTGGAITQKAINVTAQPDSKVYDGTTSSAEAPVVDVLETGDNIATPPVQAYNNKHAGTGKTLTASGLIINDGNNGANYTISYVDNTAGAITQKAINVTAQSESKTYDGTTSSNEVPVTDALASNDNIATPPVQVYNDKHVGTGKTLTASGLIINDGNNGANYTISYVENTSGAITQKAINITAQPDSKVYDGTTASSVVPLTDDLATGDNISVPPVQEFDNKHAGTGKTLIPSTMIINDGNGGANYTISYVENTTGAITQKSINVTAQADGKTYDGTTSSNGVPVVDALETGDNIATPPVQAYNDKHAGTGKTLTASGLIINDGNGGDNYTISYVDNTAGAITQKAINVTAQPDSKVYDGTTSSTEAPIADALETGDNIATPPVQAYNDKHVGTGKTLTASGLIINDGNNGANYTINYVDNTAGAITQKAINVTAQADSRVYDGTAWSGVLPVVDALEAGDIITVHPTQSYDGPNAGTGKTLSPTAVLINDGNNGNNYAVNYVNNTNGEITPATLTYTATPATKVYGDANPALTGTITGFVGTETASTATTGTLTFGTPATNASGTGSYEITGGGLTANNNNYVFEQAAGNTTALSITARPVTIAAEAKSKTYGDDDPALTYQITSGNLVNGESFNGNLIRTGDNNAGSYQINQGSVSLSSNYALSYQPAAFTIDKALLTVTANPAERCYGNSNPAFTVSYSGFKYSDNSGSLTAQPIVSTTATAGTVAGSYTLTPGGAASGNYEFSYQNGTLTIHALPVNTITSDKGQSISRGETAQLTVNSDNGTTYSWATASGILSGENTATLTVRPMQTTAYTVTVTNVNGCESTTSYTLEVKGNYAAVEAENFITPNGDGVNDTWVIKNIDAYPDHTLTIVDRAGRELYKVRNYKNDWAGQLNGSLLAAGTYYYILKFDEPGAQYFRGFITIVR